MSRLLQRGLVNDLLLLLLLLLLMMMMFFYEYQEANDDDDLEEEGSPSRGLESKVDVKSGRTKLEALVQCGNEGPPPAH